MPAERHADPEVTQALEEVRKALRQEQDALGAHAWLMARRKQLQAEREQLHRELEGLRRGRPSHLPRLPEVLTPPFDLRLPRSSPLRLLRKLSVPLLLASCFLLIELPEKLESFRSITLGLSGTLLVSWLRGPKWHFGKSAIEGFDGDASVPPQPYSEVLEVEVHTTPTQRKQGVGDVVLTCAPDAHNPSGKSLTLQNVPEPERLGQWLHDRCVRTKK